MATQVRVLLLVWLASVLFARAQDVPEPNATPQPTTNERWNLFFQATSVGQYHGTFRSPYSDAFSLQSYSERDVSLTTTLFFGLRLDQNTQMYFDPEIAGGRGFSGVNGLANSSNGELPRVASATPKPYLARLYLSHDFGFSKEMESFESSENQLAGQRPMVRYTITVGRFTLTDFFDNNAYSHDPRTQFLGWAVMYNGAWDYGADVRGYTWGWVHDFHTRNWSLRYGSGAMPRVANGLRFDRRVLEDRSDAYEVERRYAIRKHVGALRVMPYVNHADAGTYQQAIQLAEQNKTVPDITATRRPGTLKYGVGVNMEQEITKDVGIFTRLGWNDGKTESFAFTAIDRLATGGVAVNGRPWNRSFDTVGSEFTAAGLSAVHEQYLATGGHDFLIGDGRLQYGPECIWESYYSARVVPGFFTSFDLQHVNNPAYNQARGPVWIYSLRLHIEFGKETFTRKLP
ncbi:MAG TPA: carbohydrate porin [Bryobacteraceae bacterium]|jgi:high affinity Mn2+ porin|nr:carbohydrate porin [Bryobacteraceae bacterium]